MRDRKIYDVLERLKDLETKREYVHEGLCPILSPAQECVKSKCVWFDMPNRECWILNPRPLRDGG